MFSDCCHCVFLLSENRTSMKKSQDKLDQVNIQLNICTELLPSGHWETQNEKRDRGCTYFNKLDVRIGFGRKYLPVQSTKYLYEVPVRSTTIMPVDGISKHS